MLPSPGASPRLLLNALFHHSSNVPHSSANTLIVEHIVTNHLTRAEPVAVLFVRTTCAFWEEFDINLRDG